METRINRLLHQVNIVSDTVKRLRRKGSDLGIDIRAEERGPLTIQIRTPDLQTITKLAVAIEPLVRRTPEIHYEAILEVCRRAKPSPELEALVAKAATVADGTDWVRWGSA